MKIARAVEEHIEDVREFHLLEDIYGTKSHIPHAEFIEAVSTKCEWMFNSAQIRERMYAEYLQQNPE